MPLHYVEIGPSSGGPPPDFVNLPNAAAQYVDGSSFDLVTGSSGSGTGSKTSASRAYVDAAETGSTASNLASYGLSTIVCSTSIGTKGYTLGLPTVGYSKDIACITGSTSAGNATVTCAAGGSYDSTGSTTATFTSQGYLSLRGVSSVRWAIVGQSTAGASGGVVTISA